jgi:hypothetical protein
MTAVWTDDQAVAESRVDRAARAFHEANPQVYARLREIARDLRRRQVQRASIALLFERLRWISIVETTGDLYRLNNSHRAFYARLLMAEPDLAGLFETRSSATDPAFHERSPRRRLRTIVSEAARILRARRDVRRPSLAPSTPSLF